ncbi:MAG: AlpA family phage regulatory protein [Gammaproteobacteria bacterium]|nr:AlpA family transcriptional regulator [Chloroflexota bacterium]QOJ32871.1 MAG: AlpA family phage regulatory protein [Gammaproteobacteria bacterium]
MHHSSSNTDQPEGFIGAQILRLPQVCRVTGLGRSMIYQLEAERRFPCRVRIGARAVGWVESEVQSWVAGRIQHHRAAPGPCMSHRSPLPSSEHATLTGQVPPFPGPR